MPLLVLFGFPVARVVELAAVDLLVAAGAGPVDLQAADHAGAAAGHLPPAAPQRDGAARLRSEEHTSELQSLMRISYAVFAFTHTTMSERRLHRTPPTLTA